ncbi:MAG: universal stress protein, partial [Amylibacter sp.]
MYDTILVPIDLSHKHNGVKVTKIAKKLINNGGEIILINVLEDVPTYIEAELPQDLRENTKKEALLQLTRIAKENGIGSNVQ